MYPTSPAQLPDYSAATNYRHANTNTAHTEQPPDRGLPRMQEGKLPTPSERTFAPGPCACCYCETAVASRIRALSFLVLLLKQWQCLASALLHRNTRKFTSNHAAFLKFRQKNMYNIATQKRMRQGYAPLNSRQSDKRAWPCRTNGKFVIWQQNRKITYTIYIALQQKLNVYLATRVTALSPRLPSR